MGRRHSSAAAAGSNGGPRQAPGPKGLPVLGNALDAKRDPLGYFTSIARTYGDVVAISFGKQPALLVNRPDLIEKVLVTQAANSSRTFNKPTKLAQFLAGGDDLYRLTHFPAEGGFFERERPDMAPAFHKSMVIEYANQMVEIDERYVAELSEGQTRIVHNDMMRVTLEAVARTLFRIDSPEQHRRMLAAFEVIMKDIAARAGNPIRIPPIVPTPHNLRLRWAARTSKEILAQTIEEHRIEPEHPSDFIDMLKVKKGNMDFLDDPEWRYTLVGFLIAGYETTAAGLTWSWHMLAKHPEIADRIAAEVEEVTGGGPLHGSHFPMLKHTERVFREAMRLYPPIPVIPRHTSTDYKLDGYAVRAGTMVLVCPWVTHRDGRFFAEPGRFDPDRWTEPRSDAIHKFAYVPFSAGPRHCIGSGYATVEGTLALAVIARSFRFEPVPGQEPEPEMWIGLRPSNGLPLTVRRRSAGAPTQPVGGPSESRQQEASGR